MEHVAAVAAAAAVVTCSDLHLLGGNAIVLPCERLTHIQRSKDMDPTSLDPPRPPMLQPIATSTAWLVCTGGK